tara:strand:+ start:129 stop:410 length:282 start_codon:yes stop_codon:yes gene_type:complete
MAHDVKVVKLITGEEIVAKIKQDHDSLILERPMMLTQMQDPASGKVGMAFVPWLISATDEDIVISISHVITELSVKTEVEKMYLSQTSGLTLV